MPAFALVFFIGLPALILGLVIFALVQAVGEEDEPPARRR